MTPKARRSAHRFYAVSVTALSVALLAACGTTVPRSQRQASLSGADLGVPSGYVGAADPASGAPAAASGGAVASTVPTADVAPTGPQKPGSAPVGQSSTAVSAGHGATGAAHSSAPASHASTAVVSSAASVPPGPIEVGMVYLDAGATNAVTGGIGKGLTGADYYAETQAYAADINAHGGVLGHAIKMVFHKADTTGSEQQAGQGGCAAETQDAHVVVSFDQNYGGVLYPCLAKAHVATINTLMDGHSDADYAQFPLVLEPDSISLERLAPIEVSLLSGAGYKPVAPQKLGVLYYDSAGYTRGFQALKAAWAAQGVQVADAVSFHQFNTVSDIAGLLAAVQGAELKFRSEGITHVMCVEANAFLCGEFGVYASSQHYYPRYAYTSAQALGNVLVNVPARGLEGALFTGWAPSDDLNVVSAMPPRIQACLTFMTKHGFPIDTNNERDGATAICEQFEYLIAAIKASGVPTADGIIAGARKLGSSYVSSRVLQVGPRADGVTQVRAGAYSQTCSCFTYTGPPVSS